MNDDQQQNQDLLHTKRKRLWILEQQAARYGNDCPAHIIMEIEDLRKEVDLLKMILTPMIQVNHEVHQLVEDMNSIVSPFRYTEKHYLVKEFRCISRQGNTTHINHGAIPSGYTCVELSDYQRGDGNEDGVLMRFDAYTSVQSLLDDLYIYYLHGRYQPYTYGKDWVLLSTDWRLVKRIAIPWPWLLFQDKSNYEIDENWARTASLEDCGLVASTRWVIKKVSSIEAFGLAINDLRISDAIKSGPKALYWLQRHGYLEEASSEEIVNSDGYQFIFVLQNAYHWAFKEPDRNIFMRQTEKPLDEKALEFWL